MQVNTDESVLRGLSSEARFERVLAHNGIRFEKSTKNEDISHHIDYWIKNASNGSWLSVDVKAPKKINRSDENAQIDYIFVEFRNVRGHDGWLYGLANLIAFDIESDGFIIVYREDLLEICKKLCRLDLPQTNSPVLYRAYARKSRPLEQVSLIETSDLRKIRHQIIKLDERSP